MKWRRKHSLSRRWQKNHLVQKNGAVCSICSKPFKNAHEMTIDHIVPLSKGGTDTLDNYQLAHLECNQLKADMTPEQFSDFQKGIIVYE